MLILTPSELHALRKRLGHTQKRMAEIFGVSISQYGNWERGIDGRTGKECPIPRAIELACMAPAVVLLGVKDDL